MYLTPIRDIGVGGLTLFRCVCGAEKTLQRRAVRKGAVKSCGCMTATLKSKASKRHGHTTGRVQSAEYVAWAAMIQRCHNPHDKRYRLYGARGISVCEAWRGSFDAFLEDVGPRPGHGYSLERKENAAGYAPGNVIWATRRAQNRNTRRTHMLTHEGLAMCVTDWAQHLGIKPSTLFGRLGRMSPAEALSRAH